MDNDYEELMERLKDYFTPSELMIFLEENDMIDMDALLYSLSDIIKDNIDVIEEYMNDGS